MRKNQAGQSISIVMIHKTTGDPVTTGTPVVYIVIDNGTPIVGAGTKTHKINGSWSYLPTQAETNGDHIVFIMSLTNAITRNLNVYTGTPQSVNNDTKISLIPTTPMRGTDNVPTNPTLDTVYTSARAAKIDNLDALISTLATLAKQDTAQLDLDKLTGVDGATLATAQANYAPAKAGDAMTVSDKTGFSLSSAGRLAIWDMLTSGFLAVGSIGKLIKDFLNVSVSSRNATPPPSVVDIRVEIDSNSPKLAEITATRMSELDDVTGKLVAIVDLIKTEVDKLDAVRGEPGQGAPPASASSLLKQDHLYKAYRNKKTQTSSLFELYNDAGTIVDQKATGSDVAGKTTVEEIISGP